ncbi:MAG TPA: hypothetical protein VFA50_16910 [Stellaceae bacterium]|nr:hypothetical protein [Stellaceae bacterium]
MLPVFGGVILIITVLAARFGHPAAWLQVAGFVAGALLMLSGLVDRIRPAWRGRAAEASARPPEQVDPRPCE